MTKNGEKQKPLDLEINQFLQFMSDEFTADFMKDMYQVLELYDVEDNDDWVKNEVGEENCDHIRLLRTVYLYSKIADLYSGKLCTIKVQFKDLWKRMENVK